MLNPPGLSAFVIAVAWIGSFGLTSLWHRSGLSTGHPSGAVVAFMLLAFAAPFVVLGGCILAARAYHPRVSSRDWFLARVALLLHTGIAVYFASTLWVIFQ